MTRLTRYEDRAPFAARGTLTRFPAIVAALASSGVALERWQVGPGLVAEAADADILAAYAGEIAQLKARGGYRSLDIARLTPDHPDRAALRAKFLAEHVHDDDEVRLFVAGGGLFYIRAAGMVHALECTAGDLVVLPAGTRHWFDCGERPCFTALRLFTTPDGWVARFTGDTIAEAIPHYGGAA